MQVSSSLSIALFSRFAPWDRKTCYRHLINYMFKRKLSEKLLLPINLLVVLGWLYRPAVFLQILLEGVFYDVIPLILLLCLAELRLLFLLQNHLNNLRITVSALPGLTVDGCHIVRQLPFAEIL